MKEYININRVGDSFSYEFSFTQEDVINFATVTGDNNPIHLDETYAKSTIFKKRIIHGFLGGSVFSKVFGTIFPGQGTLYLSQSMNFRKPLYTDMVYSARFIVTEIIKEKKRAMLSTNIYDNNNLLIIEGEALIQNNRINIDYV